MRDKVSKRREGKQHNNTVKEREPYRQVLTGVMKLGIIKGIKEAMKEGSKEGSKEGKKEVIVFVRFPSRRHNRCVGIMTMR